MIGKTLSQYEILDKIGAGGMGEVWRARDTKLGREVAIKILPTAMSQDADRLARFEQEARAIGSLNHPNLVTLYELGTESGSPYMVMELMEGKVLRETLGDTRESSRGSAALPGSTPDARDRSGSFASGSAIAEPTLPVRKSLELAIQIAQGLAAAHAQGVTHRDLKPDNIFITKDGRAKILDFGLAKLTTNGGGGNDTMAATRAADTQPGTVLGTVGYMSPEQVRGDEVDHRSDIFSLGVVLYEMLSGRRAFEAESSVETMSAILREDPSGIGADPSRVPPAVERIVRRCLEKDREHRFQSSHDLAYALEAVQEASGTTTTAWPSVVAERRRKIPVAAVLAAAALGVAGYLLGRSGPGGGEAATGASATTNARLLPLTFDSSREGQPSISPDGRSVVYASVRDGDADLYLQRVGGEKTINLTPDSDAEDVMPAYSPDGERIAFVSVNENGSGIFVMGATGESVRRLTDDGGNPAWSPDGSELVYGTSLIFDPTGRSRESELWCVDVTSGQARKIHDGDAVQPSWSPSGEWIAYWGLPPGTGKRVLYTISAEGGEPHALTDDDYFNWCPIWSSDGTYLYFSSSRSGTMDLWRLPMDPTTAHATGPPEPVTVSTDWCEFPSLSRDGRRLVFSAARETKVVLRYPLDLERKATDPAPEPEVLLRTSRDIWYARPSPDGEQLVLKASDPHEDLFVCAADGTRMRRLTQDEHKDRQANWAPGSDLIYFFSDRGGRYDIWSIRPDGSELTQITELEGRSVNTPIPSRDGKKLIVYSMRGERPTGIIDLEQEYPIREVDWFPLVGESQEPFYGFAWSPDSEQITGVVRGSRMYLYSVRDGTYEELDTAPADFGYWRDERTLVRLDERVFRAVDLQSGEERVLFEIPETMENYRPAANDEWVYLTETRTESDIWMLEVVEPTSERGI